MTIEPQKPTVNADTIYSSVIGTGNTINQTIVPQPRKASLFQLAATDPNFTGRSHEIEKIEAILTSKNPTARIAAVSGMGGVGKSTLARAIGNRLKTHYPDGQLYVDLRGQSESPREPIAVLSEFLVDGFGDDPQQLPTDLDRLQHLFNDRLTNRKILVVLDNAADAPQVEPLLPRVSACGAIVTSREALTGLAGVGAESFVALDVMPIEEAIDLVMRLCPAKANDAGLVTELAGLCGRLPLALTIVGKLLLGSSLTLAELVRDMREERSRLRLLKYRDRKDVVDPKLDVEASFNLSYGRLLPEQQQVFVAVSVLRGVDFGLALATVLGELEEAEVRRRLDQLVALALVEMPKDAVGRYCLHDLMREFGRGKLENGREPELAGQALDWYESTADQMDDFVQSNIRSQRAATIAEESEQSVEEIDAALLSIGFAWFEAEWLNIIEGIRWAKITERANCAVKLFAYGMSFAGLQGKRNVVFLKAGEQALEAARKTGDRLGEANTLKAIGDVLQFLDQRSDALNRYEEAIDIYRQVGDRLGEANTLKAIGDVLQFLKQSRDALNRYEEAIDIYRQVGDRLGEANTLDSLALASFAEGQYQQAIDSHHQALEIFTLIESRYDIAWSFRYLGKTYLKLSDAWKAKEYFEKSQNLFEALEMTESAQFCQQQLQNLNANTPLSQAPKIGDDITPRKKKQKLPLWQSALVLLLLGIGWLAIKPQGPMTTPVEQNQRR